MSLLTFRRSTQRCLSLPCLPVFSAMAVPPTLPASEYQLAWLHMRGKR